MKPLKKILELPKRSIAQQRRRIIKKKSTHYKKHLATFREIYTGMPEISFVFQFHNKQQNVAKVLRPFLDEIQPKNIISFSDGSFDKTTRNLENCLNGHNHIVISRNNKHEISNYRLAVSISAALGASYVALFQDDDLYLPSVEQWLKSCQNYMENDENLALIGLNGGANFNEICYIRRADFGLCEEKFETVKLDAPTPDAGTTNALGPYIKSASPAINKSHDASSWRYVASANRAPQIIRISDAVELGFFPREMEPYQYDDYFNCFSAWEAGKKVMLAPISGKRNLGDGGMRLFNNVTRDSRPEHFIRNHNLIYERFGYFVNSGQLQSAVNKANAQNS